MPSPSPPSLLLHLARRSIQEQRRRIQSKLCYRSGDTSKQYHITSTVTTGHPSKVDINDVTRARYADRSSERRVQNTNSQRKVKENTGFNEAIVELLERHKQDEESKALKNPFRIRAFSNAIGIISSLDYPLRTTDQAFTIDGVGKSISEKIAEFLGQQEPDSNDVTRARDADKTSERRSENTNPQRKGEERMGLNEAIVELLERHKQDEENKAVKNSYRIRAFSSAIKVVNWLDYPLRTASQALSLNGVGKSISEKIAEFLDPPEQYDASPPEKMEDFTRVQSELEKIPGIGKSQARKLVTAGCRTKEDLGRLRYLRLLTNSQRVSYLYEDHLRVPVTRAESELILDFIRRNLSSQFSATLVGAYRRNLETTSSIEIMLQHPDHVHVPIPRRTPPKSLRSSSATNKVFFSFGKLSNKSKQKESLFHREVVKVLKARGLLAEPVRKMAEERRWHGVVRLPQEGEDRLERVREVAQYLGTYRRLELYLVPQKSLGAGLLALTGSEGFTKQIRLCAKQEGLFLDEYGLWKWISAEHSNNIGYWELLRAETEEEILKEIGLHWINPEERDKKIPGLVY